ncbi:hypothetical protein V6N12_011089 [Hibiscus sabdariffa]|uniref:Uncharacterized protein n=1 Tax=Hibiscus sabdariffa TaxID=183260 RepID=A0ABR2ENP3_9ROSI
MFLSSSESTTTSKQKEKVGRSRDNPIGTDEAINAVCLGKSSHDYANSADKAASRSLGVPELVGCRVEALSGDNVLVGSSLRDRGAGSSKNNCVDCPMNGPIPKGDIDEVSRTPEDPIAVKPCSKQALEDLSLIGF